MIRNKASIQSTLAKIDSDFVDVRVRSRSVGGRVRIYFTFEIYLNLFEALLDNIDEIEITITEKEKFTSSYFSDPNTPKSVSNDINAFFTKTKNKLRTKAKEQAIHTETYNIMDFLNDSIISKISNGIITQENYEQFLPKKDVLRIQTLDESISKNENSLNLITSNINTGSLNDSRNANDLAFDIFESSGYDPAMISFVEFPAISIEDAADGLKSNTINPPEKIMPTFGSGKGDAPDQFYELYSRFINSTSDDSSRYSMVESSERIKFMPVRFRTRMNVSRKEYREISQKNKLFVILRFKSKGVISQVETFSWNNKFEFSKLAGVYKDLILKVEPGDFSIAESDKITVYNPNNFPLKYELQEYYIKFGVLVSKKIASGWIKRKSIEEVEDASTIFGSSSTSRSYRVTAYRPIPGSQNACNYSDIAIPSTTSLPDYESLTPSCDAIKTKKNSALISIKSFPKSADMIKLFRKDIGSTRMQIGRFNPNGSEIMRSISSGTSKEFLVGTLKGNGSIEDIGNLYHNSTYEYIAKFYSNGCIIPIEARDVLHYMDTSDISSSITFNVSNKSLVSLGNSIKHIFQIEENISETAADLLLQDVTNISQAGNFQNELEAVKAETGTVTQYKIVQINTTKGIKRVLTDTAAPGKLLTYDITSNLNDTYKYRITPYAAAAAALSYKTAIEKIDDNSGGTYKFLYRKWRGQETIDREALPARSEIITNSTRRALRKSPTSKFVVTTFSSSEVRPKIFGVFSERDPFNKCNWIKWNVKGKINSIDHFLIVASYNGVQAPIGAAAPNPSKGRNFIYRDNRFFGLLGTVTYQIIAVNKELSYDDSASETSITNISSIPQFSLL